MRHVPAAALAALLTLGAAATAGASFTQELGSPFGVGTSPYGVLATDFTADGRPDVLAVNGPASNSSVSLLVRLPGGKFTAQPAVSSGHGANFATLGDFNGDHFPDVAVSNFWSDNVSILLRQPDGTLAHGLGSPRNVSHHASAIAAGDFDLDGDVDLAVGNWGGGITVLLREVGGFAIGPQPATGVMPRYIAPGDFNGDGDLDLAVTIQSNETVTIMRGKSGADFEPEGPPIAVGNEPAGIVADDLDGDGRLDLALASFAASTVTVLLRQGGGFVASGAPIPVPTGPVGITTGDFNGDGLRDLAVGSNTASMVSILLRRADGSYAHDSSSPAPTDSNGGAYSVAVADFDADSRQDLAITNDAGGSVTVLLNTTPFPAPPPPPDLDADDDGVQRPLDCDDGNAAIKPGATDVPGDGIDQDCVAGDAPYPVLDRRIGAFFATYRRYTVFTALTVRPVRAGDKVRLTCRGRRCPLRRKVINVGKDRRKLSLLRRLKRAKLRRGAVVKVRVTRPATIGQYARFKIRAPKPPKRRDACVRPGAKKPSRCPD